MRTHHTAALLLAAASLTALTACSSSSHDDKPTSPPTTNPPSSAPTTPPTSPPNTPPTTPPTHTQPATPSDATAALTTAVKDYSAAYFKPDPTKGYSLLSKRCQAKVTEQTYAQELQQAVTTYGHQKLKAVKIDRLSGTLGTVTYTYPNTLLDQAGQAWTQEGGAWRYDAC